jgi:hypothetical protein
MVCGYPLTIRVQADFGGRAGSHVMVDYLAASDKSISVKAYCGPGNPTCNFEGKVGVWNTDPVATFDLLVTPSRATPPGSYRVSLATVAGGVRHEIEAPVKVLAVPPLPRQAALPAKIPDLPGLGVWRREMTDTGYLWCDPKARYGFGNEREVWYYDGAYVFFQVYDYTGKTKWKDCALNVASQFRDYVLSTDPPGRIPPWRVFTQGLRRAYEATHDASYRRAVEALINNSAFARTDGSPEDAAIRETAYLLRGYTDAKLLGIPIDPERAQRAANYLIGIADILFAAEPMKTNATIHEDFFDGLLAEALIYYYDNWVKDPRIPPTIAKLCDWVYAYLWDPKAKAMIYNPFPKNTGPVRQCQEMCRESERTLMNLVIPAYFWYWRLTGDDAMRRRGDEMFAHALDDPIDDKGKSYSQNFKWSFDGVRWRTGR